MRSLSGEVKGEQGRSKVSEERKGVRGSMDTKKESKTVIKYKMCFKSSTISFIGIISTTSLGEKF